MIFKKDKISFRTERDTGKLEGRAWKEYCSQAKTALTLETLRNEINMELNKAATEILRRTSCDNEVAFQRGRICGLENLEKRLKQLASNK